MLGMFGNNFVFHLGYIGHVTQHTGLHVYNAIWKCLDITLFHISMAISVIVIITGTTCKYVLTIMLFNAASSFCFFVSVDLMTLTAIKLTYLRHYKKPCQLCIPSEVKQFTVSKTSLSFENYGLTS